MNSAMMEEMTLCQKLVSVLPVDFFGYQLFLLKTVWRTTYLLTIGLDNQCNIKIELTVLPTFYSS